MEGTRYTSRCCGSCRYWSGWGDSENRMHCCMHYLNTGKRRVEVDGVCKSFERRKKHGIDADKS